MAVQQDSEYPRQTQLSDWPEASHEARIIREGGEVFITGPARVLDSGETYKPVFCKPVGWIGSPPWAPVRPTPTTATIYFIGPKDGPIKIGYASRLEFRLKELRHANAYPLEVWATIEGPPSLERDYHRRFASSRLHGEWFERTPALLAEITRLNTIAGEVA